MINTCWGGTGAETWTPLPALRALPAFKRIAENQQAAVVAFQASPNAEQYAKLQQAERERLVRDLEAFYQQTEETDPGITGHWADPTFDASAWRAVALPVVVTDNPLGLRLGSSWFRKEVAIPAAWVGKALEVHVGAVDDVDITFVNGAQVGRTWYEVPRYWTVLRDYPVPAALVTSTKVTVTVRALNLMGQVGLFGPANEMYLKLKGAEGVTVPLAGAWKVTDGLAIKQDSIPVLKLPDNPGSTQMQPSTLYNGMVAPLVPYAMRGVIWYQGENNASKPVDYQQLLPGLIGALRQAWGQGDFPFAIVQLANYLPRQTAPSSISAPSAVMKPTTHAPSVHSPMTASPPTRATAACRPSPMPSGVRSLERQHVKIQGHHAR
jgi:sialate O-acetylesterase